MSVESYSAGIEERAERDLAALARVAPIKPARDETDTGHAVAPVPLPDPLPPVPAFDPQLLPAAIRPWCESAAEGLQVPLDFTAIPAMVGLAGAIGRSVGMAMKRHQHWIERPILWACIVGRPSSAKSPALRPTYRLLERLANAEHGSYKAAKQDYDADLIVNDAAIKNTKGAIQKALKDGNKVKANELARELVGTDDEPTEPRIIVNDATVEKVGELLNQNPRGLVQFRDELAGWLASLDRQGREADRGFWLECWNGTGTYTVDRIGRGTVRIEACAASILGGMQPGKLASYVRGAVAGGFSDDGLMQRFQLAVYPDLPASWRYSDNEVDAHVEATAFATFERLRNLDPETMGAERAEWSDVPFMRFDDEAQGLLIEWLETLMHRLREGDEPPWMESHLAKYQGLVGRLALVLHLAHGASGPVSADTLATAMDWCGYLEGHARRIYAPATDTGLSAAHLILKKQTELKNGFTARELQRHHWAGLSEPDVVRDGLETLVEYHHLIEMQEPTGGRPSITYTWGPA